MDPLDAPPRSVRLDDPGPHARGDPHGVGDTVPVQAQEQGCSSRRRQGAADRGGVQAVLEEYGVADLGVVGGHTQPDADLGACGHRRHQLGARRIDRFGGSQSRRNHRGGWVQHGRQVGVVEVEGVAMGAVDERCGSRWQPIRLTPDRRLRHPALAPHQAQGGLPGVLAPGGETDAHHVEDAIVHVGRHGAVHSGVPQGCCEVPEAYYEAFRHLPARSGGSATPFPRRS